MKSLEDIRKICGHYILKEELKNSKVLNPNYCRHKVGLCIGNFKEDCPLYAIVKRSK